MRSRQAEVRDPEGRKWVAGDLRVTYTALTEEAARAALEQFAEKWAEPYPAIAPSWERNRGRLTPFFAYPPAIRKVIYTNECHRISEL